MKKIIYFIFLCLFSLNANLSAHPGGHYKKGEGVIFNNWKLKNGVIVKGNFSFYKNNAIYLEQEGGRLQSVLLSDLSLQDQKLANFKINKYLALNNSYNTTSITVENHPYKNLPLLLFTIFIFLTSCLLKILIL
jgi:hypothetical protein